MTGDLAVLAGPTALAVIRDGGFGPDSVDVIAGAAGGPKWLVLGGLDRAVFSSWFTASSHPVFLIGSSIGSWRFAALAQGLERGAYDSFETAYIHQRYSPSPDASEVTRVTRGIMDAFLDDTGAHAVFEHPFFRLNLLSARCRGPFAREDRYVLAPALLLAATANALDRRFLRMFFSRTLFSDARDFPSFFGEDGFPLQRVSLGPANLRTALLASGSIPLVMEGVRDPLGAKPGMYRDGGLIDYHLDLAYRNPGLVLFLHYRNRITPGWFDKPLPWRKPDKRHMEKVVLVSPSPDFVRRLPLRKIPDRDDFVRFRGKDHDRIEYWKRVIDACRHLGEEFLDMVQSGRIRSAAQPLEGR